MTALYRRRSDVTERNVERSVFLARQGRGAVYRLNETGSALWHLLAEPVRVEDAVEAFHAAFPDEPRARVARQLRDLLSVLLEEDLVEELA